MQSEQFTKVRLWLKYFIPLMCVAIALCWFIAYKVYQYNNELVLTDAKITGTMINIDAQYDGSLTKIEVKDGTRVKAGTVLATVKVITSKQQLAQLEKNYQVAQQQYQKLENQLKQVITPVTRTPANTQIQAQQALDKAIAYAKKMNELFAIGAISAKENQQAQATVSQARQALQASTYTGAGRIQAPDKTLTSALSNTEMQLEQAKAAIKQARATDNTVELYAPVEGVVYLQTLKPGDKLKQGEVIFKLLNSKEIWLEAQVTPEQQQKLELGQYVSYRYAGVAINAVITEITPNDKGAIIKISYPQNLLDKAVPDKVLSVNISLN